MEFNLFDLQNEKDVFSSDFLAFVTFLKAMNSNRWFTKSDMKSLLWDTLKRNYPSLSLTYYYRYDLKHLDKNLTMYQDLITQLPNPHEKSLTMLFT